MAKVIEHEEHHRRTRADQSYSLAGANMHPRVAHPSRRPCRTGAGPAEGVSTAGHVPGRPIFALKIAAFAWESGPPSNTWFLGPTRVHIPDGISIGSAVFPGLMVVTDRPTDHATPSVAIGRI